MGGIFSRKSIQVPTLQRLCYDMSSVYSSKPIFVWFLGLPGSGRTTHVRLLCEKLGLCEIPVVDLLRMESRMDTDRGKIINQALKGRIKMPDELVVDLIKESLLSNSLPNPRRGFIINNFPRTKRQARLFLREIKDVDVIFYLFADMATLINRLQGKYTERPEDEEYFKKKIVNYAKAVKEALSGMRAKNEKVFTEAPITTVNSMLTTVIYERASIKPIADAEQFMSTM